MKKTITFLGSGTSHGIPLPGCQCKTCLSSDPRDCRLRASVFIQTDTAKILIDCGPDLRTQLLQNDISALDAVLLTHTHADHLNGIDDLQCITEHQRKELPFYASTASVQEIEDRFGYIQKLKCGKHGTVHWGVPQLRFCSVIPGTENRIAGNIIVPVPLLHGRTPTLGYRLDNMAYLTDCSEIPEESYGLLQNLDIMVIDGLRWNSHPTHFCISEVLDEVAKIHPKRTYITHLTHDVLHARDCKLLPQNVFFAYDGLCLEF